MQYILFYFFLTVYKLIWFNLLVKDDCAMVMFSETKKETHGSLTSDSTKDSNLDCSLL